ncbi:UNKNOWN [Stylonychia lemnae]|uniref:Uncharacterized protein n=1 Tax=Stylonychia lemnae TaxID=5949 RepID=A0A078B2E1_STYLE|nr:UNKNOWN [Stylonychia lemnae]|eukprot:CDW88715.1 UNKNOWN [Stylonychia lemnae]
MDKYRVDQSNDPQAYNFENYATFFDKAKIEQRQNHFNKSRGQTFQNKINPLDISLQQYEEFQNTNGEFQNEEIQSDLQIYHKKYGDNKDNILIDNQQLNKFTNGKQSHSIIEKYSNQDSYKERQTTEPTRQSLINETSDFNPIEEIGDSENTSIIIQQQQVAINKTNPTIKLKPNKSIEQKVLQQKSRDYKT